MIVRTINEINGLDRVKRNGWIASVLPGSQI